MAIPNPPMRRLPLSHSEITPARYESFCLAVVRAMAEVKRADLYGVPGQSQDGIDIEADLDTGHKRGIQCRQVAEFSAGDAKQMVDDATYPANEFELWLSRPVGKTVRDYLDAHPNWLVRDQESISQLVRELPREVARRLVDDHFGPAVRKAFLGGPMPWEAPASFFRPFERDDALLRHDLPLAGRATELDDLVAAATDPDVLVVLIVGRGGVGKTRLLRAMAEELEQTDKRVLFAGLGTAIDSATVDDLPLDDCVVFVDEADRSPEGLALLAASAQTRQEPLTIVLSLRSSGRFAIDRQLRAAAIEPHQRRTVGPLDPLSPNDAEALARSALGKNAGHAARRLASATADTPLLTVLGGRLLTREDLLSEGLSVDAALRRAALERFGDEQLGRVSPSVPPEDARRLITIAAALGTLDDRANRVFEAIADELAVPPSRVRIWLGKLEEAGLLLRRGRLRRVTPEVLADQMLDDACIDHAGQPTGYVEELWERYSPIAAPALLSSIGALDWRTDQAAGILLAGIRAQLVGDYRGADAAGRETLIDIVGPAASLHPELALALVRTELEDPAQPTTYEAWGISLKSDDVRRRLPVLLQAAGIHADHIDEVAEFLWRLGRDQPGELHAEPDHPVRIMRELTDYGNSPAHQDALLRLVERELKRDDVDDHRFSPLDLLDVPLQRGGDSTQSRGIEISIVPYYVDAERTATQRARARAILTDQAVSGSPRRRLVAARTLGEALHQPRASARPTPSAVLASWAADQHALLDAIAEVIDAGDDPIVDNELARQLAWAAGGGPWPDAIERAQHLLDGLSGPADDLLTAIGAPWAGPDDPEQKEARDRRVADRLIADERTGEKVAAATHDVLSAFEDHASANRAEPHTVLLLVCARSPELARGVWAWAVAHPDTMLASVCSVALSELRRAGAPVHAEAEAALASERPQLRRAIAGYLASGAWFQQPEGFEEPLLTQFVSDKDGNVARQAAVAALRLRGTDPKAAARISLAASSRAGDQDMLFATLSRSGIEKLSSEHAKLLEERLLAAPDLSWGGCRALADVGAANPSAVVRIVAARVRRGESEQGYRPVPFHDHHLDLLARAPADRRRTLLNAFLNEVVGLDRRSWRSIAAAFWWIVGPGMDRIESAESLASQEEAIGAACAALLDALELDDALAAAVLRATPWLVVVSKPEWISALMASSPSGEVVSEVERALHAAVVTGGGSRAIGAPSPRLVQTAELAERAVRQLPPGRTRRFYEVVASRARADIEQDRLDDEELESGWG